jgi:WD40 repeat protein
MLFNKDASEIISSSNHFLVVWDANDFNTEDGRMILLYNTGEIVTKFNFTEDQHKIETSGITSVKVWDITKKGFFQDTGHELYESKQLFSHQLKNNKITYSKNGVIVIEDRNKKVPTLSFEDTAYDLKQFISPAGKEHFISFLSNTKSTICIWNADTLENHQQNIKQADRQELTERWTISPDGKYFVRIFNTNARYLHLLHIESGETLFCLKISANSVFELPREPFNFSKDGKYLKISIPGVSKQIFDIENKQESSLSVFSTPGYSTEDITSDTRLETFEFNPLNGTLNFRSEVAGKTKVSSLPYYCNSKLKKCIPLQNLNRFVILTSNNELFALEPKGL